MPVRFCRWMPSVISLLLLAGCDGSERLALSNLSTLSLLAGPLGGPGWADGTGAEARFFRPGGVASDGTNLYVADGFNRVIRQVVIATGEVTTLVGRPGAYIGSADGTGADAHFGSPEGLAYDGGNLYVSDDLDRTIRKVVISTREVTTLAGKAGESGNVDGSGPDARFYSPRGLALRDSNTLLVADLVNEAIRQVDLTNGMVTTIKITDPDQLSRPRALAIDGAGNLFISDISDRIQKLDLMTNTVTTLKGTSGLPLLIPANGLAIDGAGTLFATGFSVITKVSPDGVSPDGMNPDAWTVTVLAGSAGQAGSEDGTGADARFFVPSGLAFDGSRQHLLVADQRNDEIRRVKIASGAVTTLAGAVGQTGSKDGNGTDASFNNIGGVASDDRGNVFIADNGNCAVRQISLATGEVTTLVGTAEECDVVDGTGPDARFDSLVGITSDGPGHLFVSDGSTIRRVEIATRAVTTVAGKVYQAGEPRVSTDGARGDARFRFTGAITSDGSNLYIIDQNAIRRLEIASGEVTTLAGKADESGSQEGIGSDARFRSPSGIASDGEGNLFVTADQVVWKVVIKTRAVSLLAGAIDQRGSDNGIGALARFHTPLGIASDGRGNLLVADFRNHAIRKVVIATGEVSTFAGTPAFGRITPGPLPAELSLPGAVAVTPTGVTVASGNSLLYIH